MMQYANQRQINLNTISNGELSDPLCGSDFSRRIETFSKILFQKIKFNCKIIQHIVNLETVL